MISLIRWFQRPHVLAPPPHLVQPYSYLSVRTNPFLLKLISTCRSYEFQNWLQLDEQKGTIITICQTTMLAFQSPIHAGFVFPPKHIPRQPCAALSPNLISYLSVPQMLCPCWKLEPIWQSSAVQPFHSAGLVKTDMLLIQSFKPTFLCARILACVTKKLLKVCTITLNYSFNRMFFICCFKLGDTSKMHFFRLHFHIWPQYCRWPEHKAAMEGCLALYSKELCLYSLHV